MTTTTPAETTVVDPVCGMEIAPEDAVGTVEHEGKTYYFCATQCLEKFREDPSAFLRKDTGARLPTSSAAVDYTCPMHPEIVQKGPGTCPICGMALEPRTVTLDERNPELEDMSRRFRVSAVLTAPAVVLAMGEYLPDHPFDTWIPGSAMPWVQLALTTPVVLWGGWPFFTRG